MRAPFQATQSTRCRRRSRRHFQLRSRTVETLEPRQMLAGDLVAQWLADDLNAIVESGAPVAEWTDSGGTRSATAIGSPVLVEQSLGGRSFVRFAPDDGDDGFRVSSIDNPTAAATDFSVAVAFRPDSDALTGANGPWFENTGLVDSNALGFSNDWGLTMNQAGQVSAGMGAGFFRPLDIRGRLPAVSRSWSA